MYEIFDFDVHDCLVYFGASSNIIPYLICQRKNVVPQLNTTRIIQLDRSDVKFLGELKDMHIVLASDPRVHQVIDIVVVDIPNNYGQGLVFQTPRLFSSDWSHLWLPYKGKPNQIHVKSEAHMKHTIIELEGKNEPINFAHFVLGNCFLETNHSCNKTQPLEMHIDT
jgi:hypothetical protein